MFPCRIPNSPFHSFSGNRCRVCWPWTPCRAPKQFGAPEEHKGGCTQKINGRKSAGLVSEKRKGIDGLGGQQDGLAMIGVFGDSEPQVLQAPGKRQSAGIALESF